MKKFFLIAAAALSLFAVSCKPSNEGSGANGTVTLTSEPKVSVGADENTVEIAFNATSAWRASSTASDWTRVKPAQGDAGDQKVTVTVVANGTNDSRTATVTISTGSSKVSVDITQAAAGTIGISKTSYEVAAEGEEIEVVVTTNMEFKVESKADWIVATGTKAVPEVNYILTVAPNTAMEERTGTAIFTADGFDPITVTVKQAAFEPVLEIVGDAVIPKEGGEFRIAVNANLDWDVEEVDLGEDTYIEVSRDGDEILIDIDENPEVGARTFVVTAYAKDYDDVKASVEVRQDGIADVKYWVSLAEMGFDTASNQRIRLAFDGSKLIVGSQEQVFIVNPGTGEKESTWNVGDIPHFSIDSDDAGNIVLFNTYSAGEKVEMYVASSVSSTPELLDSWTNTLDLPMNNFRVIGNVKEKAIVTCACTMGGPSTTGKMAYVAIENGKVKGELVSAVTPLPGQWNQFCGIAYPYGTDPSDGFYWTGYSGDRDLYFTKDLSDWTKVINMGNDGNRSGHALDITQADGKTWLAVGKGSFFNYSKNTGVVGFEIYNVSDSSQPVLLVALPAVFIRPAPEDESSVVWLDTAPSTDVLALPSSDGKSLEVYYADFGYDGLEKVVVPLK